LAVIINEFEAVADNSAEQRGDSPPPRPRRIRASDLEAPLWRLSIRASRVRAH